jgi:tRNA pseudouridine13 synthase
MQVKRLRGDFGVREVIRVQPSRGRHALYELSKSGWTTADAIGQIAAAWNIPRGRIQHAGLKDKHAETSQTVSIEDGPKTGLELEQIRLRYLGQIPRSITPHDIVANEFTVVVRRLPHATAVGMCELLSDATLCFPNYFDEQRFGSVGYDGAFVAHAWCLGNYERALYLALAEPNPHDRPDDREQKEILRQHWNDWESCKAQLQRSHTRSIITYLVDHPTGFKKALGLIRRDLRSLYVAAFQAKLWNEVASSLLRNQSSEPGLSLQSRVGEWFVPTTAPPETIDAWRKVRIPLPSGRASQWPDGTDALLDRLLDESFQMQRHQLRFSYPRDVFFARGGRDLLLSPSGIAAEVVADETQATERETAGRKHALRLQFSLPSAQYATMLLKVLETLAGSDVGRSPSAPPDDLSPPQ